MMIKKLVALAALAVAGTAVFAQTPVARPIGPAQATPAAQVKKVETQKVVGSHKVKHTSRHKRKAHKAVAAAPAKGALTQPAAK